MMWFKIVKRIYYKQYDVWKSPTHYDQRYLVLTKSRGSKRLKKTLRRLKLAHKTRRDIAEMIAENKKSNRRRKVRHSRKFRFDEYHKYLKVSNGFELMPFCHFDDCNCWLSEYLNSFQELKNTISLRFYYHTNVIEINLNRVSICKL